MAHVLGLLLLGVTLGVQEVGEKDHLDDDKKDKQLDEIIEQMKQEDNELLNSFIKKIEKIK